MCLETLMSCVAYTSPHDCPEILGYLGKYLYTFVHVCTRDPWTILRTGVGNTRHHSLERGC